MAFNAGVVDAKYMGIKSKTIKVDGDYKVTVPMSNKALSERKQATIELMKVLAPLAKVNMSTMVSIKDHGLYDPKTNTIYIDLAMDGRDVMIFTLAHELTHHLKRINPEQFDEFARALFEEVGKTENVEERIAKWMRENKKYYPNMAQAEFKALAREEVVAEMCESFLTDEKVVQRISQKVYETDKGLWNTIKKWFENLVAKLKKLFADLDPQSENGRIVREMGDRLDAVRQMWADMVVEAGAAEGSGADSMVKSSKKDFEDYDKPITLADVEILRSIGRKSINKFTAEEIKKAQKWAYKFYKELGVKSPFFRAWFGEWRAHDQSKINIVSVPTINISEASLAKGDYIIRDTGWNVYAGKTLNDDTRHHSGGDRINVKSLNAIESILDNAILFDTVVSEPDTNKKSGNTAFLHKLYTPIQYDGKSYIAITTVEEFYNETINNVSRRAYNLKAIKIELAGGQLGNNSSSSRPDTSSINSISDLYEFVKTFDKEFTPAPQVSKYMLNEDGTPKKFYHGSDANFEIFDYATIGSKTGVGILGEGFYFSEKKNLAKGYGKNIGEYYLQMSNPYIASDSDLYSLNTDKLSDEGYDGVIFNTPKSNIVMVFDNNQIKSSTNNIGTFSKYEQNTRYSRKDLEKLDADYLSAVERGDMETAQIMVDEAAKKTGYTVKGYHGSHNSFTIFDEEKSGLYGGVESRIGFWFGTTKKGAENWANETWGTAENNPQVYDSWLKIKNPKIFVTKESDSESIEKITKEIRSAENEHNTLYEELRGLGIFASWTVSEYIRTNGNSVIKNLHNIDENTFSEAKRIAEELVSCNEKIKQLRATRGELIFTDSYEQFKTEIYKLAGMDAEDANVGGLGRRIENGYEVVKKYRDNLISQGYDGIIIRDTRFDADTLGEGKKNEQIVVFAPNQIKSADPVTYDDKGNVIPLSQRFNARNEDIRYSIKKIVDENGNDYGMGVYLDSTLLSDLTESERIEMVKEYVKELGGKSFTAFDSNGTAIDIHIAESSQKYRNNKGKKTLVNKDLISYQKEIKQESIALIDELIITSKYRNQLPAKHSHGWLDNYGKNDWEYWATYIQDKENTIWEATLNIATTANGEKILYDIVPIKKMEGSVTSDTTTINSSISQSNPIVNTNLKNSENFQEEMVHSRKNVDPITSREELAKALSKVAKGEDRAIVESYKANVNLIKGETARLESLRKEIDEIKYKKSITYEGRELSVKEFEQIAYTRAEEQGMDVENCINKNPCYSAGIIFILFVLLLLWNHL